MSKVDEEGLHDAIAANPADDGPWLILADSLLDQGEDSRAELIRLSVQLRRSPTAPGAARLEARLRELVLAGVTLPLPRQSLSLGPGVALEMVLVPPGSFVMGSPDDENRRDSDEGPARLVRMTRAFWLGTAPVTQEQWLQLRTTNPGRFHGGKLPVDGVSWSDCQEFLAALSARLRLRLRLPTEAEWEYACRACTSSAFFYGDDVSSDVANFDGNYPFPDGNPRKGPWLERTTPAGTFPANTFGLHDLHGNVWEWCDDWHAEDYYQTGPSADPPGPSTGSFKVLRGGSWYSYGWSCRSAGRERFAPESGAGNYGFRVAMDHAPAAGGRALPGSVRTPGR